MDGRNEVQCIKGFNFASECYGLLLGDAFEILMRVKEEARSTICFLSSVPLLFSYHHRYVNGHYKLHRHVLQ